MMRHIGVVLLIAVFATVGGFVAWRALTRPGTGDASSGGPPPRIAVEVARVTSGTLRDVRVLSGTLEASTQFDVAAKVGGLIEQISVDLGDEIARDQVIATIDDAEYVQAVAQAEAERAVRNAEVAQANAELDRVQKEYDRLRGLSDRGVVSDRELDEISASLASQQAAVTLAEARVRQAEASLELARIQLGYTNVTAAWEGGPDVVTVGQRYEEPGETIQAGSPLVSAVGLDELRAAVSITERDYPHLRVGQAATLTTDALPDRAFEARITRIAPIFRETSRQARVELAVDNPARLLKPGMFARVSIVLREEHADVVVPLTALTRRDGRDVVFTLADDGATVRLVPVRVSIIDREQVSVTDAVLTQPVVVLGQQMLTDGTAVNVHTAPPPLANDAEDAGT